MPPKSSNKKKAAASWYFCEKCNSHITSKSCDFHEKVCPIAEGAINADDKKPLEYIRAGELYTCELQRCTFEIEELKELSPKFLNNLIFMSEGAIRLAGFHIGQNVQIIVTTDETQFIPIVRSIWPLPEKFLTTVFVSDKDYEKLFKHFKNSTFCIKSLPMNSCALAKTITLEFESQQEDEKLTEIQIKNVTRLLKLELKDLIFTIGSNINFSFFNKDLTFKLVSWSDFNETQNSNLEKAFENLSLKNSKDQSSRSFFKVIKCTQLEIATNSIEGDNTNEAVLEHFITKADIGGLTEQLKIIEESMNLALGFQKSPSGIKPSRGMLLYGSSGCGKTLICEAMSTLAKKTLNSTLIIKINASEIFSKFLGETEKNLTMYFEKAYTHYPQPSFIIVEDVHNLCPKNETNDISKRVSIAFAGMLDELNTRSEARSTFLLATSSEIESISSSIRRCGRLDAEIEIGAPAPKAREEILHCGLRNVKHELTDEEISEIAQITHGFVGADLINLISQATLAAHKKSKNLISSQDLHEALTYVKPSAMREVLIENPNVHWTDIGGQADLKLKLKQAIEWPLLYPDKFKRLGIKPPRGILMYGPPGCSKTMIAKALATESKLNFLSIKGPELFSMWVGESERAVREVFRKARQVAPSIVFFDEIDAIGGERAENSGSGRGGGSSVQERVLTQLLTELDGVEALQNVTIVAATNRPDMIDKALLRPGRIDRIVYVGLPDAESRREIFRIKLSAMPLATDVDIEILVQKTENYTGAEIQAICHEAALKTLEEDLDSLNVSWTHFVYALENVKPRTSPELLRLYDEYAARH